VAIRPIGVKIMATRSSIAPIYLPPWRVRDKLLCHRTLFDLPIETREVADDPYARGARLGQALVEPDISPAASCWRRPWTEARCAEPSGLRTMLFTRCLIEAILRVGQAAVVARASRRSA
jgi:hypothetical protein